MKKESVLYLIVFFIFGCSTDKQEEGLPCIDISKNYPEKEIILTDIADVSYLCLNSDNKDFLYNSPINISSITKNTVVLFDSDLGKILFFSKDGSPKSQFTCIGQGPEECVQPHKVIYDEEADEVFVYSFAGDIQVYSSTGKYKRKIVLPEGFFSNYFFLFDNESFLLYDAIFQFSTGKRDEDDDRPVSIFPDPCVLFSRTNGEVLDFVKIPTNEAELVVYVDGRKVSTITKPVIKTENGFFLCNPSTDTVFLYDKNRILTPVICKTPLVKDLNPKVIMNNCLDFGGYQFLEIITIKHDPELPTRRPIKYLIRNKKTGEVLQQKITLPDYKGKDFILGSNVTRIYDEGAIFELELAELKQADRENKLSGKLKELVTSLNEDDDNNIFMFVDFSIK
jgi:hypothetical protein